MNTMRKFLPVLGVLLAVAVALPAVAPAQVKKVDQLKYPAMPRFDVPQPTRVVLDNGMVVILIENHELALIDASARVHTGARLEPADKVGLAGITGMVLRTGGTTSMTGEELDEFLEDKAAYVETGIGTHSGTAGMAQHSG